MDVIEACDLVLGKPLAKALTDNMGFHWTFAAAMADCKVSHGPEVKAALVRYLAITETENTSANQGGPTGSPDRGVAPGISEGGEK